MLSIHLKAMLIAASIAHVAGLAFEAPASLSRHTPNITDLLNTTRLHLPSNTMSAST